MNFTYQPLARGNTLHVWDLVVRGLPRKWQPVPTLVNPVIAQELLGPELIKLEALGPDHNYFPASLTAAALLSLHTHPASEQFWRRYIDDQWVHDDKGYDPVGVLKALIDDCKVTESVSRTPGARYLIFRSALSLSILAAKSEERWQYFRYETAPTQHNVVGILEQARISLGQGYCPEGFVHPELLRPHMDAVHAPQINYSMDTDQAVEMARADGKVAHVTSADIHRAQQWLAMQPLPPHLSSPPALAAAIQTTAQNEDWRTVWEDVFHGRWQRFISGRSDLAGRIHSALQHFTATKRDLRSAVQLYRRCQSALEMQRRQEHFPDGWINRPWGGEDAELQRRWNGLQIDLEPEVIFTGNRPRSLASPTKPRTKPETRAFTTAHKTGKAAEMFFLRNFRTLLNDPTAEIFDHTDQGCGYDFLVRRQLDGAVVAQQYEIKGDRNRTESVRFTDLQWKTACKHGSSYNLVVIEGLATEAVRARIVNNPAAHLRPNRQVANKPVVSWQADAQQLESLGYCVSDDPSDTEIEG